MRRRLILAVAGFAVAASALAPPASAEPAAAITAAAPQQVVRFDTATPAAATQVPITGLRAGEVLRGIDYRPANGMVYGWSNRGALYILDTDTGAAVRTFQPLGPTDFRWGVDFNPVVDRLRLVNDGDFNYRLNVDTGMLTTDLPLAYAPGDDNEGADPEVAASAYTNNFAGTGATVLYGLDSKLDILVTQAPPNDGRLNTIGSLGVPFTFNNGFDVSGATAVPYAALTSGSASSRLYRVDLGTGAATLLGVIGDGSFRVGGLTILPA